MPELDSDLTIGQRTFDPPKEYILLGIPDQGLKMSAKLSTQLVEEGLSVRILSFTASLNEGARFNPVDSEQVLTFKLQLAARKNSIAFYKVEILTDLRFENGNMSGFGRSLFGNIPKAVLEEADEISLALVGDSDIMFLFEDVIPL